MLDQKISRHDEVKYNKLARLFLTEYRKLPDSTIMDMAIYNIIDRVSSSPATIHKYSYGIFKKYKSAQDKLNSLGDIDSPDSVWFRKQLSLLLDALSYIPFKTNWVYFEYIDVSVLTLIVDELVPMTNYMDIHEAIRKLSPMMSMESTPDYVNDDLLIRKITFDMINHILSSISKKDDGKWTIKDALLENKNDNTESEE